MVRSKKVHYIHNHYFKYCKRSEYVTWKTAVHRIDLVTCKQCLNKIKAEIKKAEKD